MVWILRVAGAVVALIGFVVTVGSLHGFSVIKWPLSMVAPGVALLTAGLAALVGMQATVSWATQRRREIEASEHSHREAVYEELLTHMTEVFTGGSKRAEAEVRSKVALWGSKETLEALADWHRKTHQIMSQGGGSTTPQLRAELWDDYYRVLAAARRDLNPNSSSRTLSKDLVLGMIFSDYPQHEH